MQRPSGQPGHGAHLHREPPALLGTRLAMPAQPLWDVCCAPAPAALPAPPPARRARLADLDANVHCSIIGTCLPTAELRRLVPRYAPQLDRKHARDLQIHHTAVELSTAGGPLAKELNKALDTRHAGAIKQFRAADDAHALTQLWQQALAQGDVPGAYWALMTHPAGTPDVRALAFGDVHMLSHLVGAANRADLRRLGDLEEQCARLKEQNLQQQARLHELGAHHAATVDDLRQQLLALKAQRDSLPADAADLQAEVQQLRAALADRDQKLALHTARRHEAEQRLQADQEMLAAARAASDQAIAEAAVAQHELGALEQALLAAAGADNTGASMLPRLDGITIGYVGGRPGTATVLGNMVAAAGGELLLHDGGIEDRRGLLAAMLPRAHLAVFPVDAISHNAMHVTRQTCARHGIACHPLRSASVASFIALLQRLYPATAASS